MVRVRVRVSDRVRVSQSALDPQMRGSADSDRPIMCYSVFYKQYIFVL